MTASLAEIREWMTPLARLIAGGLLAMGLLLPPLFRRSFTRLWFTVGVLATWGVSALLSYLPTPPCLAGDGYAVTTAIGAMGALYTLPFVTGVVVSCGTSFLIKALFRCILSNRKSPPR